MMSAAHALIEMPTECGRTTARNGQQYLDVLPTNPLAISLDEGSSSSADEIGNLERRRGHWGTSSSNVTHTYIKAAGRSLLRSSCAASAAGRLRPNELTTQFSLARRNLRITRRIGSGAYLKSADRKGTNPVGGGDELLLRAIACPLEDFDAIGFAAGRVEDFAVAYALESGAYQAVSQHVAGRI